MKKETSTPASPTTGGRKNNGVIYTCITLGFLLCLFLTGVVMLLTPDKAQSETENRVLAQKPRLTWSSLTDGSFMRDYETYLTDQFPHRDAWVSLRAGVSTLTGAREQNGVYRTKSGFLLEKQTPFDASQLSELTSAIKSFLKKNKSLTGGMILAPNASLLLQEEMPYGLRQPDQQKQLKDIHAQLKGVDMKWVSCLKQFEGADAHTLYYRTDHHWTTRAAFRAFLGLSKAWKLGAKEDGYTFYPVATDFSGTLAATYGERRLRDTVEVCIPKESRGKYTVYYEAQGKKTATLFASEKLQEKNKYEVFLGGNFDKVIISTTANTENTLLLFKDSYANCLIPMLTPYFSKIVVIDPRYFNDSLSAVMEETTFTHVLFVYNANTFLEDRSLAPLLKSAK